MDIWSPDWNVATWTLLNLLSVFSYEVTVKNSDLKKCKEDEKVCVTDLRDCGNHPPSSLQKTQNLSCYYQLIDTSMLNGSLICEVSQESNSHAEPDVSLIVSSMNRILSCDRIFNSVASFNITASIKIYINGTEKRSPPLTFNPSNAVKPSQPVLMVLRSTKDSVVVSWRSTSDNSCRLRYRVNNTLTWSQTSDFVPVSRNQKPVYTIEDLLPFTIYRAAVACREKSGMWSDWSPDVTVRTLAREPSRAPEVCYGVEKTDSGERFYLMWKGISGTSNIP